MQPRQTLRLFSLIGLLPGWLLLLLLFAKEHPPNFLHLGLVIAYLYGVLIGGVVYARRHRAELRDPPAKAARHRQWLLKHGGTVLNALIAVYLLNGMAGAYLIYRGRLDHRRAWVTILLLVISVPAILLMIWVKRRLRLNAAKPLANSPPDSSSGP
jgi:hypothetical protein